MAVTGTRARDLLAAVLERVQPHLPPGVQVEVMWHEKGVLLRRTGSAGAAGVGGSQVFGARLPLVPRSLGHRLAARDAVEMVLRTVYVVSTGDPLDYRTGVRDPFDIDLDVKAISRHDSVIVSYRVPGEGDTAERVELDSIPNSLL
jgi:hypothetical protein